jgi:peptidyl-prolyl cis-trans isomerase A (cyclophilin A)
MDVVERLYAGYGEAKPTGKGPEMNPFYEEGNAYLERDFPKLDYIRKAAIV